VRNRFSPADAGDVEGHAIYRAAVGTFDTALVQHIEHHLADEEAILREYRALVTSPDDAVRYLARLILDDEQRHHQVLGEMLNTFRSGAGVAGAEQVPSITRSHDSSALQRSVKRLRAFERHDLRQLRKLDRHLKFLRRDSLNGVLVSAMIMDTRKHLRYLRALRRIARR
jgi:hypothetical protein